MSAYARLNVVVDLEKGWGSSVRTDDGGLIPTSSIALELDANSIPHVVLRIPTTFISMAIAERASSPRNTGEAKP